MSRQNVMKSLMRRQYITESLSPGAQLGKFERGRRYICKGKNEIIQGLGPRVKCVAPLFRDMSLAKV